VQLLQLLLHMIIYRHRHLVDAQLAILVGVIRGEEPVCFLFHFVLPVLMLMVIPLFVITWPIDLHQMIDRLLRYEMVSRAGWSR